jgi:glycosyltransferase involved in cell wall biosynthesis
MVAQTDATIAVTDFLRDLYDPSLRARIHVVHDGIEDDSLVADSVANATKSPSALLVTSDELNALPVISTPPPGWRVKILGRYPPSRAERLRHIYWSVGSSGLRTAMSSLAASLDPRVSRIPWSPKALARAIRSVQIGIIPVDRSAPRLAFGTNERAWRVKSENRLTLLMAAGLPVIATPIPSYESVVIDGVNGYLASSLSDWRRSFDLLRDADVRREMGKRARASVLPRFSLQSQGERFVRVLNRVVQG